MCNEFEFAYNEWKKNGIDQLYPKPVDDEWIRMMWKSMFFVVDWYKLILSILDSGNSVLIERLKQSDSRFIKIYEDIKFGWETYLADPANVDISDIVNNPAFKWTASIAFTHNKIMGLILFHMNMFKDQPGINDDIELVFHSYNTYRVTVLSSI